MNLTELVRRSPLIMPVNQPRFVENVYRRGIDAIAAKEAHKAEALRLAGVV